MEQLTLPLFKGEQVEKEFDFTHTSKHKVQFGNEFKKRTFYVRRGKKGGIDKGFQIPNDKDYTFVHVSGFNFCGQPNSNTVFRFITNSDQMPMSSDVLLPELNDLPKDRLIDFIEDVILRYQNGEFEWDTETRTRIYNTKLN